MEINNNGSFNTTDERYHYHDNELCNKIIAFCKVNNIGFVADLGCGKGTYVQALKDNDIHAVGYDGNPNTSKLTRGLGWYLDLSEKQNLASFQCVLSLEVGEHIDKEFEENFIYNITHFASKYLILSWAIPGQGGYGHVNERDNDYIIDKIEAKGFMYLDDVTEIFRSDVELSWFKNTVMVFERCSLNDISIVMPCIYREKKYINDTLTSLSYNQKNKFVVNLMVGNKDSRFKEDLYKIKNNYFVTVNNISNIEWYLIKDKTPSIRFNMNFARCMSSTNFQQDILYIEDDVEAADDWYNELARVIYALDRRYNSKYVLTLYGPWKFYTDDYVQQITPKHFYGTQAVYIKKEFQEGIMNKVLQDGVFNFRHQADLLLDEYCAENNIPILCLTESLFQHKGEESTGLGNFHYTENFR